MAGASLDGAVDWTRRRLRADFGLLATVALALIGVPAMLAQVVQALAPKEPALVFGIVTEQMAPTPTDWVALLLLALAVLLGTLTVARMLITPGETVRQSLDRAGRQLPAFLLAVILFGAVLAVLTALVAAAAVLLGTLGAVGGAVGAVVGLAAFVLLLIVMARISFLTPSAIAGGGPLDLLRRAYGRSRGVTLKLLLLLVLTAIVGGVVVLAAQLVVGIPIGLAAGRQAGVIAGAAAAGLAYSLTALVTLALVIGLYVQTGSGPDEGNARGG